MIGKKNLRTLSELIDNDDRWNLHDIISFKSVYSSLVYYKIKMKYKNKIIKHMQVL